ncbi:zinc finger protein 69-like [Syngnathus acus]|uniref:zinc finger protein 69-like n=1 Tax=Syngnathus acus TaxID=161584 RepID=UPI0018861BD8|nr:zinc finger protein 69-like [Syngnathus acus]
MLKEFVRERLIAAADEIFGLFERTIASYEEQLCRQRRQLEAACQTQFVISAEDIQEQAGHQEEQPRSGSSSLQQENPPPPLVKEEEQFVPPHIKEEEEGVTVSQSPLTRLSVASEDDKAPKWRQLHHHSQSGEWCGGALPDDLCTPPSHCYDVESYDGKRLKGSEKERTRGSSDSRFTCPICGRSFAQKLHRHMRTHTGEKPFRCATCGKRFSRKEHLEIHMRIHTGEKPFSCSICPKTFTHKTTMASHMRMHTGEKPFSCAFCGKAFSQKQSMLLHVRIHTRGKPLACPL